jgi:hypothetical protein
MYMEFTSNCACILYSGKFSLVQNFAELHVSPSEEIFVIQFSRLLYVKTTPTSIDCMYDITFLRFRGSYFRRIQPICEKREILHHTKISRYTVSCTIYKHNITRAVV